MVKVAKGEPYAMVFGAVYSINHDRFDDDDAVYPPPLITMGFRGWSTRRNVPAMPVVSNTIVSISSTSTSDTKIEKFVALLMGSDTVGIAGTVGA